MEPYLKLIVCTCTASAPRSLLQAWKQNYDRYHGLNKLRLVENESEDE